MSKQRGTWLSAVLAPTRTAEDLLAGWWPLIEALGTVAGTLVWDGDVAAGRYRYVRSESRHHGVDLEAARRRKACCQP